MKGKEDIYRFITEQLYQPFVELIREKPRLDPFSLSREFFIFFARYKNTAQEALLRQALYNARSMNLEALLNHIPAMRSEENSMDDLASRLDRSSLKVTSADECVLLFVLLQTVAVRLLFAYLNGKVSFEKALVQIDQTFDLLRYGFVKQEISVE